MNDLEFDLLWSLKVKCVGGIKLPVYEYLLVLNSKVLPK